MAFCACSNARSRFNGFCASAQAEHHSYMDPVMAFGRDYDLPSHFQAACGLAVLVLSLGFHYMYLHFITKGNGHNFCLHFIKHWERAPRGEQREAARNAIVEVLSREKGVIENIGIVGVFLAPIGHEAMFTDNRHLPSELRLAYAVVVLCGIILALVTTILSGFIGRHFPEEAVVDAARAVAPLLPLPSALLMVQSCTLIFAIVYDFHWRRQRDGFDSFWRTVFGYACFGCAALVAVLHGYLRHAQQTILLDRAEDQLGGRGPKAE